METVPEPEPLEIGAEVKEEVVASRRRTSPSGSSRSRWPVAAIGVVRSQNVVHAALYLVVVLAGARRAVHPAARPSSSAWVQVLIYIGAIVMLFLFGIMLTRAPMRQRGDLDNNQRLAAAVVVRCSSSACSPRSSSTRSATTRSSSTTSSSRSGSTGERRRRASSATTSIPFEVVSMLLLAALVGAVVDRAEGLTRWPSTTS